MSESEGLYRTTSDKSRGASAHDGGALTSKDGMFHAGIALAECFCELNRISMPTVERLNPSQRNYHIGTCAYYRPTTIHIMVEKCANRGFGGRAWSWPGYAVDRTPFGVIQHELGHHVDTVKTGEVTRETLLEKLFSKRIWEQSREAPLTGYLGTDRQTATFWMEWFAENFRLFVTNPGLSAALRPRFCAAIIAAGIQPLHCDGWETVLLANGAPSRIIEQSRKKIKASCPPTLEASGSTQRSGSAPALSNELSLALSHDRSLAEGAPEKEPEGGHPTGIGRALGSPKLPARRPTDPSAQRSPNGAEGRLQASEASVWVNGRAERAEGRPQ